MESSSSQVSSSEITASTTGISKNTEASTTPFSLTVMTALAGHATKRIIADPITHLPIPDPSRNLGIGKGTTKHLAIAGLAGLAELLSTSQPQLTKKQALIHGIVKGSTPESVYAVVKRELLKTHHHGATIARTLEHFHYATPHLIMLDVDPDPKQRYDLANAQELMAFLSRRWPLLCDVGYLSTVSTSRAIYHKQTGECLRKPRGLHVYLLVRGDVVRFREIVKAALWCDNTGYCLLAKVNSFNGVAAVLERCMVDVSVFSPERLDYVAGCEIDTQEPWEQRRPDPVLHDGGILDLDALSDVTPEEREQYHTLVQEAKAKEAPKRFADCAEHVAREVDDKTGLKKYTPEQVPQEVAHRIALANRGLLAPDHPILLDNGRVVLVKDIAKKHHLVSCHDPEEPDYGPGHAIIYWNSPTHICIHSLAHGFSKNFYPEGQRPPGQKLREEQAVDEDKEGPLDIGIHGEASEDLSRHKDKRVYDRVGTLDPAATLGTVHPCTQGANAQRLVQTFMPTLRYTTGLGWLLWTGTYWRVDTSSDDALTTGFVRSLPQLIATEAETLTSRAFQQLNTDQRKALLALAAERLKWAIQSDNASAMAGALKMAKGQLFLPNDAFDAQPWLFNCLNGTIDLRTGERLDHNPTHFLTRCAPVMFDDKATCPRWERFLSEVFAGDTAMIAFIQRALGWSLTGVVQERALFFLYGPTAYNGKTTLVETYADVVGSCGEEEVGYARKVDVQTFMKGKNFEDNQRKVACLVGPRFVYTSEVGEGQRLNEQLIKDITGDDKLEARRLYHEAFAFKPVFKPWMYGNHKPDIHGTDEAIWGRVKLIDFTVSFRDRMDTTLGATLREERAGILNWAIAGCLAWQEQGLRVPEKVQLSTALYRKEQDVCGAFIRDRCDVFDKASVKAARLYEAYKGWCLANGYDVWTQHRFGNYLTLHNYLSDDNATGRGAVRSGLDLKKAPEPDDDSESATLCYPSNTPPRAKGSRCIASKDDTKSDSATLATLDSDTFREGNFPKGFPESKGSKGSTSSETSANTDDAPATLPLPEGSQRVAKGSSFALPPFCPGCAKQVTWFDRGTYVECYKCHYHIIKGA